MSGDAGGSLEVRVDELEGGVHVVVLRGELDVATGGDASAALAGLSQDGHSVLVDLSGLQFVDSSGVKMLVAAARAVEASGGSFVVCSPGEAVARVIAILHLADVVTVVARRDDALAEIAEKARPS